MKFKQEFSQISIDINIAKSKIESLENLQQMNIGQLQRIYRDKRDIELKNRELEAKLETKIDGSGGSDLDFKLKMD